MKQNEKTPKTDHFHIKISFYIESCHLNRNNFFLQTSEENFPYESSMNNTESFCASKGHPPSHFLFKANCLKDWLSLKPSVLLPQPTATELLTVTTSPSEMTFAPVPRDLNAKYKGMGAAAHLPGLVTSQRPTPPLRTGSRVLW